jgi:hypothetical protein
MAYLARSVLRVMALIVLATICFLACAFLLFVLVQWMRDGKRKTGTRPDVGNKPGQPYETRAHVVSFPGTAERRDRPKVRAHQASGIAEQPCGREFGRDGRERIAYKKIARFSGPGKRT